METFYAVLSVTVNVSVNVNEFFNEIVVHLKLSGRLFQVLGFT